MYAYNKYINMKEREIRELQKEIDELKAKQDAIKKSENIIDNKWWWNNSFFRDVPTIPHNIMYNSMINVFWIDKQEDLNDKQYDYYIILLGEENYSDESETIFDVRIKDIKIYNFYSTFVNEVECWLCGGARFATIQIKLLNDILYYKYENHNYIKFPDDFVKEILEIICPKK